MAIRYLSGINVDSNTLFVDDVNNRVGVGTGSPAYTLDIATSSSPTVRITRNGATDLRLGASIIGTGALIGTYSNSPMSFLTNSVVQAVITEAGNVGIGTTSPNQTLEVKGADSSTVQAIFQANAGALVAYNGGIQLGNATGNQNSQIYHSSSGDNTLTFVSNYSAGTGNKFIFAPGGTERVRFLQNGNVGIGTTSPGYKLDVTGDINFTSTLKFGGVNVIHGTFADIYANIRVIRNASTSVSDGMYIGYDNSGGASGHLRFFANGTNERMRIDASTGNVGIGTTSPAAKFQVTDASSSITLQNYLNGAAIFLDGVNGDFIGGDYFHILADGSSYLGVGGYAGGATPLNVSNAGNVGIGTTSPSALLHVATASTTGTTSMLLLSRASGYGHTLFEQIYDSTYFTAGKTLTLKNDSGTAFAHFAGNNAGTRTDLLIPTGNVGIGTNAPITELEILSSAYDGITMSRTAQSGGTYIQGRSHDTSNVLRTTGRIVFGATAAASAADGFITFNTFSANSENERMRITSAGNVGIGTTSPSGKLSISTPNAYDGTILQLQSRDEPTAYNLKINEVVTAGVVRWSFDMTNSSAYNNVLVFDRGKVGIGTTDPTQIFHVSGNIRVTGAYYDSSNSAGSSGQVLSSTGSGTDWVSLSEITGVDGTGTANYIAKWSDTDTITNSQIRDDGTTVGVGTAPAAAKLTVDGALTAAGQTSYGKSYASLDTTGVAVAGLSSSTNGQSALFTFTCYGGDNHYQRVVYSCKNDSGSWYTSKVVDEGTNGLDVTASANGATITFTYKARSANQGYSPRILIDHLGSALNTSYL